MIVHGYTCDVCSRACPGECDERRCDVCRKPICDRRPSAIVCSPSCRAERSRRRRGVRYVAKAHSAPASRPQRAPDLRISYRKAIELLTPVAARKTRRAVEDTLTELLSPAARAHLRKDQ